jgi:SynChlorMet cassette radical SAM/SPASM protein ScmF
MSAGPSLTRLYFYLTEGCNLACRHCWLAPRLDPEGDRYAVLPGEVIEKAIDEAKPLGLRGVKLTGGEPLLHPRIADLLRIVQREELELVIETNGTLCTPDLAAEIAKSEERFVSVSLDGADAKTHDGIRGVEGSFGDALQAVRNLVTAGTPPQIVFSLMEENLHQAEEMVRLAEEAGASSVKYNVVQPTGRGRSLHDRGAGIPVADLIALGRKIETEVAKRTELRLFFDYPMAFRPLSSLAAPGGCDVCGIMGILGVLPSGEYALCGIGSHVDDLVFGAVGTDPLEKIWRHHPVLQELRTGLPARLEGTCSRCLMSGRCLGACVAQNHYRTGSLWAPFWFCEEAEKEGLFPASRMNNAAPSATTEKQHA